MIPFFPKQISQRAIIVYVAALISISVVYIKFAMSFLYIVLGLTFVLGFFLSLPYLSKSWLKRPETRFVCSIFLLAVSLRLIWVVASYFYYIKATGLPFEFEAADSMGYHDEASWLSVSPWSVVHEWYFGEGAHGISDVGYPLYLTILYKVFGINIIIPRIIKAFISAYTCVLVYRLSARSFGEETGRIAGIICALMPNLIIYCGYHLKETEMLFLATLALERFDRLIRSSDHRTLNIILCVLFTLLSFGFRTAVGMILIGSYIVMVLFSEKEQFAPKKKVITLATVALSIVALMMTPIGKEILFMFKVNFTESDYMVVKYNHYGMKYADYASYKTMAPGVFVLPLTNMVEVANGNQKMMNGTYFVKNYLAFFAMWCFVAAIREKKARSFRLIGSYTLVYLLMIAFSFAVNSERYHLPALPGIIIMAAFAMTHFRKKDFPFYYVYCALLLVAIVAWNYLKLAGRGLIF